jgi:hypothetical protein
MLELYKTCLASAGTRMRMYTTIHDKASLDGRLPHEAAAVLEEIKTRMKEDIRETKFQSQFRIGAEFKALSMAGRNHADFRSMFEQKLGEMHEYGCAPDEPTLFREYFAKISDDLRSHIRMREWRLDPVDDLTGRRAETRDPQTWEEVAKCCVMVLETRCDVKAPKDSLLAFREILLLALVIRTRTLGRLKLSVRMLSLPALRLVQFRKAQSVSIVVNQVTPQVPVLLNMLKTLVSLLL